MAELNLGRIRPTYEGKYDASKQYDILSVVDNEYGVKFISIKPLSEAGIPLTDTEYWTPVNGIFTQKYQGVLSEEPTKRVDGSELQDGDLYLSTTDNEFKIYSNGSWITGITPINGFIKNDTLIGDGETTDFTVNGGYINNVGFVTLDGKDVTNDVDITDGETIKFKEPPANGSVIRYYFFNTFNIANTYTREDIDKPSRDIEFTLPTKAIILIDRSDNSKKYRLFIDNGNLGIEEVE